MQNQQETGKKRLSLDVFQEKAVGTSMEVNQNGGVPASDLLVSVIVVSIIILTISSDNSRCCNSSDCHPS